jgi:translocation and assembly module TamB
VTAVPKRRRKLGCLLRACAVLFAGLVLAYVTRKHALFPLLAGLAERYVEARFDADLVVEGLEGDGWRTLSARRLELAAHAASTTRLRRLEAHAISVRLSLWDLVRGRAGWLAAVRADSVDAAVDLTQPGSSPADDRGDASVGVVPYVDVARLSGFVELGNARRLDVKSGSLRSRPSPGGPALALIDVAAELRVRADAAPYAGLLSAELVLGEDELLMDTARFVGDQIKIDVNDLRAPWASITVDRGLRDVRAEMGVAVEGLLARFGARGPAEPSQLVARGGLRGGALIVDEATLSAAGGAVTARSGRLTPDADGRLLWSLALECDVPDIESLQGLLGSAGWSGALTGRASVEGRGAETALELHVDAERLELAGLRFGTGTLEGSVAVDLRDPLEATGRAAVRAGPAWIGGREIAELTGDVELTRDALRIEGLHAAQPGNRLDVPDLVLPRTLDPARMLAGARGSLALEATALERVLPELGGGDQPAHRVALSATIADGVATLGDGVLEVAGGALRAQHGTLHLSGTRSDVQLDFSAVLDFPDLAPVGRLIGEPDLAGRASGHMHVGGDLEAPTLALDVTGSDLLIRGLDLTEIDTALAVSRTDVQVARLRAVSHHATIEASGDLSSSAGRTAGTFKTLRVAREDHELVLRAPFAFALEGERISLDPFALEGSAGSLEFALERDGERWSADAKAVGLDLEQVLPERGFGRAEGRLRVERTADDVHMEIAASLAGWRVPGFEGLVDAEIDLEQTGDDFSVRRLELAATDGVKATFTGSAPFDWTALFAGDERPDAELFPDGELSFHATSEQFPLSRLAWPAPWDAIARDGKGRVVADVTGTWSAPRGRVDVDVDGLRWTGPRDLAIGRFSAELTLEEAAVTARIGADQPARFAASGSLRLGVPIDARALERADFEPLLLAPLQLDLDVAGEDLAWLPVRLAGVRRSAGAVKADLGLRGSIAAPRWQGVITVAGGEMKLDSDLPSLVNVEGELTLDGSAIKLTRLTAELGGAPISAHGSIEFPVGESPVLRLAFRGQRLLLRRDPEVLLRADANLTLTGTWRAPVLLGKLDLRRSWLTKRVTLLDLQPRAKPSGARGIPLFSFREPPFRNMTLDLEVTSSEAIQLRGNVARGGLRPALRIAGTGEVPRLEGAIALDPTTVLLPGATVEFRGGTLTFEPSNPFVPRLQLIGQTEKFGHDITVVVTGPYDAPEVDLSASPPLSSEDILLILLAGRPPTGFATSAVEATQTLAIYLAQDFASAWLDEGNAALLERVEVVTGREASRNGVPTIEIRLRVSDHFPVESGSVYLSGERDVFEDSNMGIRFAFRLR